MALGLLVCYAFGTAWFLAVYARAAGPMGLGTALGMCVVPFVVPYLVKLALALPCPAGWQTVCGKRRPLRKGCIARQSVICWNADFAIFRREAYGEAVGLCPAGGGAVRVGGVRRGDGVPGAAGRKYLGYVDLRVLCLLLCLMAVVAGFQSCGAFQWLAGRLLARQSSGRALAVVLVLLPFFTSMAVTNDVSLITFAPFTMMLLDKLDCRRAVHPPPGAPDHRRQPGAAWRRGGQSPEPVPLRRL